MTQADPFAPPATPITPAPSRDVEPVSTEAIAAARRALAEHVRRPGALETDRALEGRRVGGQALGGGAMLGVGVLLAALGGAVGGEDARMAGAIIGGLLACLGGLVGLFGLVNDLRVGRRADATDPAKALSKWFLAARTGKKGYAFVGLAPSARGARVAAPSYFPEDTPGPGVTVSDPEKMKAYLQTFARPGRSFVRWFRVKRVQVVREDGDVAVVSAELDLTKWPQWANVLSVVLFVVIRLIGIIIGAVLFFTLRKRAHFTVEKTLLRGPDGLWYLLDADLHR